VVYLVLGRERDVERGAGLGHDDLLLGEERDRLGDAQVRRRDALAFFIGALTLVDEVALTSIIVNHVLHNESRNSSPDRRVRIDEQVIS
jgi:hypothetical protein